MTDGHWRVERVRTLTPEPFAALIRESRDQGFRFLGRLFAEWRSGANRFDGPGEALFVVFGDDRSVLALCGLNVDPFQSDPRIARLRHLYVRDSARRRGLGRHLTRHVLAHASALGFSGVRLRTDTTEAARFYESLGFRRCEEPDTATHEHEL